MLNFKNREFRERSQQNFDKEKITIKIKGKDINVYDMIQESREDTEIYPTLEKYGCIDKIKLNRESVYTDWTELQKMQGLRGIKDQQIAAENMFYNLPKEIRKEFDNNINKFTKEAEEFVNKLKSEDEKIKNLEKQAYIEQAKKEVKTNE